MKQIISKEKLTQITPDQLTGREYIAYRSRSKSKIGYCVLTALSHNEYGFIPLLYPSSFPVYTSNSLINAVEAAAQHRDVRAFDTMEDMLNAMTCQEF